MAELEIESLWKGFGGNQVLKGLSLAVDAGSITGVVAANGAGKTTMINVVFGIYPKDEGRVVFRGVELPGRPEQVVARGLARTFQNAKLPSRMTVSETLHGVKVGRHLSWGAFFRCTHDSDHSTPPVKRLLEWFSLEDCANVPAGGLPFVQQRKLDLARAVATGARFLFLDEPAAGLSETEENELVYCIRHLRDAHGFTFVVIDHRIEFLRRIVDRAVFLHGGKVEADSASTSVEELLNSPLVRTHYFGADDCVAGVTGSTVPSDDGSNPTRLSLHSVSVYRGGMPVVRSVDYACRAGELSSIVGPNGSGKSSLLECMAGMVRPRSGSVRIDGLEMDADQIASDSAVALVPESLDVFPDLTVEENLRLGCRNGTRARWKDALAEMARVYPVFERQGRRSGSILSGGERKMMAIARAGLAHPKVLLVDEASAGLAPAMIQRTYTMLRDAAAAGIATVTAESQPGVCEAYSARVDRLHRGEFVGGTAAGRTSHGNGN